jgi:hypothetical protein
MSLTLLQESLEHINSKNIAKVALNHTISTVGS